MYFQIFDKMLITGVQNVRSSPLKFFLFIHFETKLWEVHEPNWATFGAPKIFRGPSLGWLRTRTFLSSGNLRGGWTRRLGHLVFCTKTMLCEAKCGEGTLFHSKAAKIYPNNSFYHKNVPLKFSSKLFLIFSRDLKKFVKFSVRNANSPPGFFFFNFLLFMFWDVSTIPTSVSNWARSYRISSDSESWSPNGCE